MAVNTNATLLANLVDPEVIGSMLNKKLIDLIKFSPLAQIDTTLVGSAGDEISLPYYTYLGDAVTVLEGQPIPIRQLTQSVSKVKIHKIGNGAELTDEAMLSAYGDPLGEAVSQLATSIASTVDNELLGALEGNTTNVFTSTNALVSVDDIADALALFGEDIDGDKVIMIDAATYAALRKTTSWIPNTDIGADLLIKGVVGMIHGCQVVVTNRIKNKHAYIVKPQALALFMKRDTMVEADRDIINKSTIVTADKHFAVYLKDATKAIKITF